MSARKNVKNLPLKVESPTVSLNLTREQHDEMQGAAMVGVIRCGRQYQVIEYSTAGLKKHPPERHGLAMSRAITRLEDLGWYLHNQPWTEEQIKNLYG